MDWTKKCNLFLLCQMTKAAFAIAIVQDIDSSVPDVPNCICVPYWQCKEDYSGLVEDGVDIMDIRVLKNLPHQTQCTGSFDVCCKLECGHRNTEPVGTFEYAYSSVMGFRVLGENNEAQFAEFPWMVGILEDKRYRCGASLIHPQAVLTAAHCVSTQKVYKIRAGEWNWESVEEPIEHQDRMSQKVIIHHQYDSASLHNDIALVLLESPFRITQNVGFICIPLPMATFDYSRCIVTGWGKNYFSGGKYQATLKKIEVPIVPNEQCVVLLQNAKMGPNFNLHRSFVCAGGEENKDACKGDGGGPLVCPVKGQLGRYEQVGIVAWGLTCGMVNAPGVYVNVAMFSEWIDGEMERYGMNTNIYKT